MLVGLTVAQPVAQLVAQPVAQLAALAVARVAVPVGAHTAANKMIAVLKKGLCDYYRPFLFYFSLATCCLYVSATYPFLGVISFFLISTFLISDIISHRSLKKQYELLLLLIILFLSIKYRLLLSLFAAGLLKINYYNNKKEELILTAYALFQIIVLVCENLYSFGFPLGVYFIYFWGLGYLVLSFFIAWLLTKKSLSYLPIIASALIVASVIFTHSNSIIFIQAKDGILDEKGVHAIYAESEVVPEISPQKKIHRQTIVVPLVDGAKEPTRTSANGKERVKIVLFGEHDNMNGFIKNSSRFRADSHLRRSPWSTYSPNMKTDLKLASLGDPLYCSNIGATISHSWDIYPLVWDYDPDGTPALLAASNIKKGVERVFFGDSDPIVNFLSPYNILFLQSLFSLTNVYTNLSLILVCISIAIMNIKKKYAVAIASSAVLAFLFIQYIQIPQPVLTDFKIHNDNKILSPHYSHDVGSTPAAIVKAGYSVSIYSNGESTNSIYILSNKMVHSDLNTVPGISIVFMLPGSKYIRDRISYRSLLSPMGTVVDTQVTDGIKEISVVNARSIQSDRGIEGSIIQLENLFLIGTESPQKNVHILKHLLDSFPQK